MMLVVLAAETPPLALQMVGLKHVSLRHLNPWESWHWCSELYDVPGVSTEVVNEVYFGDPQYLADELQEPCAEHGWRCDLRLISSPSCLVAVRLLAADRSRSGIVFSRLEQYSRCDVCDIC